jgi:REP element-mobilizing transposase RayT
MARKLRQESPDAIFHVYSRGNYRQKIFDDVGASGSFLTSIHEVALRAGWHVYTYAIMPNHFHLMLRTPRANLGRGMHLLLSGFACRFNGLRDEQGHVFQGRYHAKRMPGGLSAGRLFDYINLNRVRKGLATVDELSRSDLSGVWALCHPAQRGQLRPGEALERFIGYPDTPEGWANYNVWLKKVSEEDPEAKVFDADWTHEAMLEAAELAKNPKGREALSGLSVEEAALLEQRHVESAFDSLLTRLGKSSLMLEKEHGVVSWKVAAAIEMLRVTTVSIPWLTRRLNAGSVTNFTKVLRESAKMQRGQTPLIGSDPIKGV